MKTLIFILFICLTLPTTVFGQENPSIKDRPLFIFPIDSTTYIEFFIKKKGEYKDEFERTPEILLYREKHVTPDGSPVFSNIRNFDVPVPAPILKSDPIESLAYKKGLIFMIQSNKTWYCYKYSQGAFLNINCYIK